MRSMQLGTQPSVQWDQRLGVEHTTTTRQCSSPCWNGPHCLGDIGLALFMLWIRIFFVYYLLYYQLIEFFYMVQFVSYPAQHFQNNLLKVWMTTYQVDSCSGHQSLCSPAFFFWPSWELLDQQLCLCFIMLHSGTVNNTSLFLHKWCMVAIYCYCNTDS